MKMEYLGWTFVVFVLCVIGILIYAYYKRPRIDFEDTFPQVDNLRPVGLRVLFQNEHTVGGIIDIPPTLKVKDAIVVPLGAKVGICPYVTEFDESLDKLKMKGWMFSITSGTYLKHEMTPGTNEVVISSACTFEGQPLVQPKELHLCFEAIDVRKNISYRVDVNFIHTF